MLEQIRAEGRKFLPSAFEPSVADGEREGAVVSGIVRTQAGAR